MSVKGLLESEKKARGLQRRLETSFNQQTRELKQEIAKVEYLLGDREAAVRWANSYADPTRVQSLTSLMNEVERLYLSAGNSNAARIFKQRMERQFRQRLTNLKANELEVSLRSTANKARMQQEMVSSLTDIRRDSAIRELYKQSREAGGMISGTGRGFMQDLVTLETKAAGSKTIGEYMENLYNQYEQGLKDVFVKGIIRGDSYAQMEANLMRATDITKGKARILVRTEANAIFNESVRNVIDKNPLVKGYRYRAVLDSKTSSICQDMDGTYIPKEDVVPGRNFPPLHPNCRSTVTTILVSENEKLDTVQRYTKNASNQWEEVPPGMTYREYKDKFGFSNSKNPRTYNARQRDIGDASLARIERPTYQGYVKPSASSTRRIREMTEAYIEGNEAKLEMITRNTRIDNTAKALLRQSQAEAGFDGLPLQLSGTEFTRQVERNEYTKVYRQFARQEDLDQFLRGEQYLGTSQYNYGVGTYTFVNPPEDNAYGKLTVEMAIKSDESKILDLTSFESQGIIGGASTPDIRINNILQKVEPEKRRDLISVLATQYGYDALKVSSQLKGDYMVILNRTAAIVKGE